MISNSKKKSKSWGSIVFGLISFALACSIFFYLVLPPIWDSVRMQSWQSVQARIISGGVQTFASDQGPSYEAFAVYRYRVNNEAYENNRVLLTRGAESPGTYQQNLGRRIESAKQNRQSLQVWYDPDNPTDSIIDRQIDWIFLSLMSLFAVMLGGVGTLFIWLGWNNENESLDENLADKPWLQNNNWKDNLIRSNAKSTFKFLIFGTVFWNLMSLPFLMFIPQLYEEADAMVLLILILPLAGVGLIFWTIRSIKQWKRFGPTPLTMDPFPGSTNGDVGGSISVNIPYDSEVVFKVILCCFQSYEVRKRNSGRDGGYTTSTEHRLKWQADGYAEASPDVNGIKLSFLFEVPDKLPISEPISSNYHFWRLKISAELEGIDLDREFNIPVYALSQSSQTDITLTTDYVPKSAPKISLTSILPVVPGTQEREIYYGYFKHPFQSLIGFIFGTFFAGIGVYMWSLGDDLELLFIAGAFFLIGGFVAFICLLGAISSSRLSFDGRILSNQTKILGVKYIPINK